MNTHPYRPDWSLATDFRGQRPCVRCGLPRQNRVHAEAEVDPEIQAEEARRLGEAA